MSATRITPADVPSRLDEVRERIERATTRAGRGRGAVTLVAVSKAQPVEMIAAAYAAGHRDFGENRSDELVDKANRLPDDIRWHFVGALQSRKAPLVRPHVSLLHSLDRTSLIRRWATVGAPPVLAQVNIGSEPQKAGVAPGALGGLLSAITAASIDCRGLMIIPPVPEEPDDARVWCRKLVELAAAHRTGDQTLSELSMGMTDDYEVAVEEGSTMVRVGRAIFGARA